MKVNEIMLKMISESAGNLADIEHYVKVTCYARMIAEAEGLDEKTKWLCEAEAIVHDISCPLCRKKYGNTNHQMQEKESEALLREFFSSSDVSDEDLKRIIAVISRHHSPERIDGIDNQILIEADYLVNANQSNYQPSAILAFRNTYFRTACGTRMLDLMYAEKLREAEKNRTA